MKSRKILALILTIAMVFGSFSMVAADTAAPEGGFADMPDNWSTAALNKAVGNGLLMGYTDGDQTLIKPDNPLTRAELAAVVNRAFASTSEADISKVTDVAGTAWYAGDMAKAVKMGTFALDTKMRPDDKITRQEAFAVLARAFKLTGTDADYKALGKFTDKADIAAWALKDLDGLAAAGYVQGSAGKLNPKANITRAEFAVVMDNLVKQYIDEAGTVTEVVAAGNVMVRVAGVTLKDVTVKGDLIIADGVGEGDVTLDSVTVEGRTVVRGGGENSIIIKGNSDLGKIIVAKVDGVVRIVVEGNAGVEIIYVDDGPDDVIVEGTIGTLEVAGDNVTVTAVNAAITNGVVSGDNSKIILSQNSTIQNESVEGNASEIVVVTPPSTGGGGSKTVAVSAISVDPVEMYLELDKTATIKATVLPGNATNKRVTWTTSDESIATVANGVVTPVAVGEATITATTVDGGFIATCVVSVINPISESADVVAGDFGVMDFSHVVGYNVGFVLSDATASDVKRVVITLYGAEEKVLATNTSAGILEQYSDATSLSAPFDVFGNFDYEADGCWEYSGWLGENSDIPTKAEITVTFKNGVEKTVTNDNHPTGDISIFSKKVVNTNTLVGYDTIQEAINAAEPGHVLNVAPGTYEEPVIINKANLTVKSTAGAEKTILDGDRGSVTLVNIKADGVTFSGFTLQNAQKGISINSSNNSITNNIVADVSYWSIELNGTGNYLEGNLVKDQGSWGEERQPRGIFLYGAKHATLRNNQLINAGFSSGSNLETHDIDDSNTVNGKPVYYWIGRTEETVPTDAGMVWLINCDKMTVEGLNINSTERAIYVLGGSNHRISNNILGDANATTFPKQKNITHRAIWVSSVNDSEISNNTIISARCGIQVEGGQNNVIRGNAIADTRQAIVFEGGEGNLAIGNALVNPVPDESYVYDPARWTAGFTIWGNAKDTRLEQNHVANFEWGINQHKDPRSGGTLRAFGTVARDNCFIGSIKFPAATNLSPDTVLDARYNYWGYPEGPHHSVTNPDGKGESIGDNVLFYPWYENEDMTEQSFIGKIINSRTLNTYRLIQNAVEQAEPGDTIWVDTGTYTGDLTINVKDLSLESLAGADVTTIKGTIVIKAPNVTIEGFTIESDDSNVLVAVEDGHDCDLQQIFDNNTFPDGSQVIGNEIKVFVAEENTVYNKNTGAEYNTIQGAISDATVGDTIIVGPGTYTENIIIDNKAVNMLSFGGRKVTTIKPKETNKNTIELRGTTDGVRIGAEGKGFTIDGPDNDYPAVETASIYLKGSHYKVVIEDNEVVANGDAALLAEYGATLKDLAIINNTFSGKTFVGEHPAGEGMSQQFDLFNVPRILVYISGPNNGLDNKADILFTKNLVSGVTGGINESGQHQGNTVVNIDADGVVITDNIFYGNTARTASASLRARGVNTVIEDNEFRDGELLTTYVVLGSETVDGGANAVKEANTFESAVRILLHTIYRDDQAGIDAVNNFEEIDFNETMLEAIDEEELGEAEEGEEPADEEELDISSLEDAIEASIAAKEGIAVSEDGTDVSAGTYWATQEDMDALDAAIAKAEAAKETAETQEDVDDVAAELEAAIATFNEAKQEATGGGEIGEPAEDEEPVEGEGSAEDEEPVEGEELEE